MYRVFVNIWAIMGLVWMAGIVTALSETISSLFQSDKVSTRNEESSGDNFKDHKSEKTRSQNVSVDYL